MSRRRSQHLMERTVREGTWFRILDSCASLLKTDRNRRIQRGRSGMIVHLATGGIGALSALHPLMMQDVWGVYRAMRSRRGTAGWRVAIGPEPGAFSACGKSPYR